MISLNLLPPGRKIAFRWRSYVKKVISSGIKTTFLLACFSVPLFAVNIYLKGEIDAIKTKISSAENTESMKKIDSMEASFKQINNILLRVDKLSAEQISWIDVFKKMTDIIPYNVQIFSLQIGQDGSLTIIGKAKTREDVLEFGKRLKNSSDFSDIQTPLDNLIRSYDIDFKFTGNIKLDNFKLYEKK